MRPLSKIIDWLAFPYSMLLLLKDPTISARTKWKAGALVGILFVYMLNPADLIPDIAPALGWLDDLLAIPVATAIVKKATPEVDVVGLTRKARGDVRHVALLTTAIVAAMALTSLAAIGLLIYLVVRNWPVR
jgi:uncharacterized membrane protein YkvA (DUF1232 family)